METTVVKNLEEMHTFVDDILAILPQKEGAQVLLLTGDLGAGKTTFTQILAEKIGVEDHVVSPTFMIMRTYDARHPYYKKLVHIDAYRIEDESEIEVLHIPELFHETGTLVCIEWPERIPNILPEGATKITFVTDADDVRTITYGN